MYYENRLGPPTGVVCGRSSWCRRNHWVRNSYPLKYIHGLLMVVVSWDEMVGKKPTDPKPSQDPKPSKQIWGSHWGFTSWQLPLIPSKWFGDFYLFFEVLCQVIPLEMHISHDISDCILDSRSTSGVYHTCWHERSTYPIKIQLYYDLLRFRRFCLKVRIWGSKFAIPQFCCLDVSGLYNSAGFLG